MDAAPAASQAMQLVALTRWNPGTTLDQELPALAPALGLGLYDARLKLVAPLPALVGTSLAPERVEQLFALLRSRGHGAISLLGSSLLSPDQMLHARSVGVRDDSLFGGSIQGQPYTLPLHDIIATLRAHEQSDETQTVTTQTKQLAMGRAILTGGLLRNKSVSKVETHDSTERQQVAYVFRAADPQPLVLKEQRLNYEGLGDLRGITVRDSFNNLIAHLRQQLPAALHDDRLLTQKRLSNRLDIRGISAERVISNSNASPNAVAAQLILLAHQQGQL